MTQEHIDRLAKLAEHLEKGQLGHVRFDFSTINDTESPHCGTAGCALGELPIVWPNLWSWNYAGLPTLKDVGESIFSGARIFFGLSSVETFHLFYPDEQLTDVYGGKDLDDNATRYEVAANIRAFIEIKTAHPDDNETAEK